MSAVEKNKILALVVKSSLPHRLFLAQLRLVKSTYHRWVRWEAEVELGDHKGGSRLLWNKLRPEEEAAIMVLCSSYI